MYPRLGDSFLTGHRRNQMICCDKIQIYKLEHNHHSPQWIAVLLAKNNISASKPIKVVLRETKYILKESGSALELVVISAEIIVPPIIISSWIVVSSWRIVVSSLGTIISWVVISWVIISWIIKKIISLVVSYT